MCHQRLSPFPQRRPKRQHAHTKPLLEILSLEDQFCHASTSPTRLGMRRTGEPPTCSQCGARVSNTGKNTPRSSDVQKKMVFNASSMSLAQIKWKHLHFHRCAAFDMSLSHVRTRSTCVKSEDTTVLFPLVKNPWNQSLLKRNVQRRKIHYWAQQKRIWSLKVTSARTPSLLPTLLRFGDLRLWGSHSTSSASAHGTGCMQPRFLITCVFFVFFVALLVQVLRIRCLSWMSRLPLVQLHVEIGLWICPWPFVMGLQTRRGQGREEEGSVRGGGQGEEGGNRKSKGSGHLILLPAPLLPFFRSPRPPHPPPSSSEPPHHLFFFDSLIHSTSSASI